MLLFWKLVDETQMGNPCENTARDILSKFSTPQSHLLYIISLWDTLYTSNKLWIFMNFYQDWVFRKKQVKQNFIIRFSWKDAVSSKVCKKFTIPARFCLSVFEFYPTQFIHSGVTHGYFFLSIFIGNLFCCWNPLYNDAWCYLVEGEQKKIHWHF